MLLFGLFLTAVFAYVFAAYSPHIIDDAYITFRFSERIAEGKGITYNDGVRIQGSSTPIWMLILAGFAWLGVSLPFISAFLGAIFTWIGFGFLTLKSKVITDSFWPGLLASLFLCGHLFFIIISASGMETPLYVLITLALLYAVVDEKWKWIGVLSGLLLWTRYDGAITVMVVFSFMLFLRGWKETFIQGLITTAIYLPWLIFAQIYFGNFIPQTVQTKLLIHHTTWHDLFFVHVKLTIEYFPYFWAWLPFFLIGLWHYRDGEKRFWILPIWLVTFVGVFLLRRTPIVNFIWYLVPIYPIFFLIAAQGIFAAFDFLAGKFKFTKHKQVIQILVCCVIAFFQLKLIIAYLHFFDPEVMQRERAYMLASDGLLDRGLQPGDSVLTGEVGAIGYALMDANIIDGYGLVSPEVYEIRKADRERYESEGSTPEDFPEGSPQATVDMVEQLKPDYILIQDRYLHIRELYEEEKFAENYRRIEGFPFDEMGNKIELIVMERISENTESE